MGKLSSVNNAENRVLEKYKLCILCLGFFSFCYEEISSRGGNSLREGSESTAVALILPTDK